jgi:hypothetical protein
MKSKLSNVGCKYGSPFGRLNSIPDDINTAGKLYLEKLKWVNGCYTPDGTYWGGGNSDYIYRASGESETEQIEIFVRGITRQQAKNRVKEKFPQAKFFR